MEDSLNAASPYSSNGKDRISRLQDDLIHCIMSFMDTKYAVQTSVLSKRWIHIWKSLPFLKFKRSSFSEDKKDSFIRFVDMVFIFRKDMDVQNFSVYWLNSAYDESVVMHVDRWSLNAVKRNVHNIIIVISQCHNSVYEIPHLLLNCKSLRKLLIKVHDIAGYLDIILPRSMKLPQLKVLNLKGLSISNVESCKRLFASCPVLETLVIHNCDIQTDEGRKLVVGSVSLKMFEYSHCYRYLLPENDSMDNVIKLCTPNLEEFFCRSFLTLDCTLENCLLLSKVYFGMRLKANVEDENPETYSNIPSTEKAVYTKRVTKFLRAVYMVKSMKLSAGFLEVLSQVPNLLACQQPRLCNLKSLVLQMWFTRGCLWATAYLLKFSPNITELLLTYNESNLADIADDWEAGLSLPGMLSHLEFVQIEEAEGCDALLKFLSFLLKNAMVLKQVLLYPRYTIDLQFREKLRALPRASSCIILLERPAEINRF